MMLPVNEVQLILRVKDHGLHPRLKAGIQKMDISQHMVQPSAGSAQDHSLGTAHGHSPLNGKLCVCVILFRLMHFPHNVIPPAVLRNKRRLCRIKIAYDHIRLYS